MQLFESAEPGFQRGLVAARVALHLGSAQAMGVRSFLLFRRVPPPVTTDAGFAEHHNLMRVLG